MAAEGPWPPVRAVLLDCLGTLLRLEPPGPRLRVELARRGIMVSEESAAAAFRAEIDHYLAHHLEGTDAPSLERLRDSCARVVGASLGPDAVGVPGVADPEPAVREAMLAALRFSPYPDAAPALAGLRRAGLRLVVTSNWDCSLGAVLEGAGLRRLVDSVVTSAEVGAAKPDPAVFRAGLEAAACPSGAAVCVGDSLRSDVGGARAVGARAVLLARGAGPVAAPDGVPVVRSLGEARSVVLAGA